MKILTAAALALVIGGCARAAPDTAVDPRAGATLVVDNQSTLEMNIYALRGAQRVRLGQARALQSTTLRIPADLVTGFALRFLADPIGSRRTPISEEISVWPGETVEIRIPPS
jgi:hypothetical protein